MKSADPSKYLAVLIQLAAFGLGYALVAWISLALIPTVPGIMAAFWAPSGISLGVVLLSGLRFACVIPPASLFVSLIHGAPFLASFTMALGNTAEILLAQALFHRWVSPSPRLERHQDVLSFLFLCALPSTAVGAMIGFLGSYGAGMVSTEESYGIFSSWWRANFLSLINFTPFLLAWVPPLRSIRTHAHRVSMQRLSEFLVWATICSFASILNFTRFFPLDAQIIGGSYMLGILLIGWTLRFEMLGATLGSVLLSTIAVLGAYYGRGPFLREMLAGAPLNFQVFLALHASAALLFASLMKERQAALDRMREAVQYRDQFISVASHELKTPLTSIILQIELTLRLLKKSAPPNPRAIQQLETATAQSVRLRRLIEDLLDVSKLLHRRVTLEFEPLDLSHLVQDEIARLELQAQAVGCAVTRRIEESIYGLWDRVRIGQVVANLFSNAIKYGCGRPIEIGLKKTGDFVLFWVRDNGQGLAPEDQARIFEKFERAVTASKISGLGLGLYITRQIVEAQGGRIWVTSQVGFGSTFFVELPLRAAEPRKAG